MSNYYLKKAKNAQFYFLLKAANGFTILTSETYVSKQGCKDGIESVKKHSPTEANYRRLKATNGQHYFNLVAANYQVIGTSEMYNSTSAMENGIDSVKANGPGAGVVDETVN